MTETLHLVVVSNKGSQTKIDPVLLNFIFRRPRARTRSMIVGEFSSLELRVGAKMKKSSRIEERVSPAQEEWQQIIVKNIYVYI